MFPTKFYIFGDNVLRLSQSPLIGAMFPTENRQLLKGEDDEVSIPSNRGNVSDSGLYFNKKFELLKTFSVETPVFDRPEILKRFPEIAH